jgi:hypothetical protein
MWTLISIPIAVGPAMWLALMKIKALSADPRIYSGTAEISWDLAWLKTTRRLTCALRSARHSPSAD